MNIQSIIKIACSSVVLVFACSSLADNNKMYIGSSCSFADHPLASHHKIHHRFVNTSGSSQWVTCPLPRDYDGVNWIGLDTVGTTNYVRFEQRAPLNGSLSGWNAEGSTATGGTGRQHYWFSGSAWANGVNDGYFALEVYLADDAYINGYRIAERN